MPNRDITFKYSNAPSIVGHPERLFSHENSANCYLMRSSNTPASMWWVYGDIIPLTSTNVCYYINQWVMLICLGSLSILQDGGDNLEDNQLERFVHARAFCDIT